MSAREADLIAGMADLLASEDLINTTDFRAAMDTAKRLRQEQPEIVEQGVLMPKAPSIPDGWSWDDIGPFTGALSGIRLQKGEPIVEQRGHRLYVRLGEFYSDRQVPIYRDTSLVPGQAVLVVLGLKGVREGFIPFVDGEQLGPFFGDAKDITAWITDWLYQAIRNPLPSSTVRSRRKAEPKLPLTT